MTANLYAEVTAQIVAQLEKGVSPWSKPWTVNGAQFLPILPRRVTGEAYKGVNILLLMGAAQERGYRSANWMTFQQAKELKGCVRKGETATRIVYASTFTKENDQGEEQQIPFLKTYCVFNVEQIDGLPDRFYSKSEPKTEESTIAAIDHAEEFFAATGAAIRIGGGKAFYVPSQDFVQMPPLATFTDAEAYYGTLAHEVTHWTGHESRCNRTFGKRFGDNAYAMEELVAELGSAFLCAELGLELSPREDHASYLQSWLGVLKADHRAIFTAASKASEAVALILEAASQPGERIAA